MAASTEYDRVATELVDLIRQYPHSDDRQIIFDFFRQNSDYLDLPLIGALTEIFQTSPQIEIANFYLLLGNRFSSFTSSNKVNIIEIEIWIYKLALKVYTKQEYLQEWVEIQFNLGNVYSDRIKDNGSDNLEESIKCYRSVLDVITREDFSIGWANTQYNLGNVYSNRIKGDKADNLEESIKCYKFALNIYTKENLPTDWADTQYNLGNVYSNRIKGDKADNLEESIKCYKFALNIYTKENLPTKLANIQYNLGNVYSNRIKGDKADNLEESIKCYKFALNVRIKEKFPTNWATIQSNLGAAYLFRIKGDKKKNLELSIQYSESALTIFTAENSLISWAIIQVNLGTAYLFRIEGDKKKNLELSIQYSESALTIFTAENSLLDSAKIQGNLGAAYLYRIEGNKKENLELSIQYSESALTIFTPENALLDLAKIQLNLGVAYLYRIKGDKKENLELSIKYCKAALETFTKDDYPLEWARTQRDFGNIYEQMEGDRTENLKQSIVYYQAALETCTPQDLPIDCLQTAWSLGNLHFNQGNWQDAIDSYETAMQATETSRSWSVNDQERQRVLTQALSVYENAIQCAVNLNDYKKAIEYTERVRSRQLVELIASKDLYNDAQVPAEIQAYLTEYQQLNQQIENLRPPGNEKLAPTTTSRTSQDLRKDSEQINQAEERKQVLYNQIRAQDKVLAGQIAVAPISHNEIQQLITSPHTAILTFYSTDDDTHIFILKHDREPELFVSKSQGKQELQQWLIDNWLNPYTETDNDQWQRQMPAVLAEISARLQLPQLIANHLSGIEELVLVPHLLLHQIPFAALPIDAPNQLLGEKFTIRSIPSCQILQYCQERPPIHTNVQGIVEDADDSLMGARYEGQKIAEIYSVSDGDRLRGKTQATIANYRQLLGRVNRIHSSHHASSNLEHPLESSLQLADGKITLGDLLLGERYQNLDEIFLSACETHVGMFTLTDDVATITTGFLCIGARSVQSTLWSVNDLVTAIFDVFYHQERREGFNRAVSLKKAQVRLRYLSGEEFKKNYYPELKQFLNDELDEIERQIDRLEITMKTLTGNEKLEISKEFKQLETRYKSLDKELKSMLDVYCQQATPFAAPYYWAGFICQGMA